MPPLFPHVAEVDNEPEPTIDIIRDFKFILAYVYQPIRAFFVHWVPGYNTQGCTRSNHQPTTDCRLCAADYSRKIENFLGVSFAEPTSTFDSSNAQDRLPSTLRQFRRVILAIPEKSISEFRNAEICNKTILITKHNKQSVRVRMIWSLKPDPLPDPFDLSIEVSRTFYHYAQRLPARLTRQPDPAQERAAESPLPIDFGAAARRNAGA